jgi:hypothetical protein
MANKVEIVLGDGLWVVPFEFTITTAGAVVANSDGTTTTNPYVSVVRASAGTYTATIVGNFQKVVSRFVQFVAAAASSVQAQITAIGLGTGTATATGEATTTATIITGNSNAVPAAADQAAGTIACRLVFQKNKI